MVLVGIRTGIVGSVILVVAVLGIVLHLDHGPVKAAGATSGSPATKTDALEYLVSEYSAENVSVALEGSTSLSSWASDEPGLASGISVTDANASDPVYAYVVTGSFQVQPPAPFMTGGDSQPTTSTAPPISYSVGRILVDKDGHELAVTFWPPGSIDISQLKVPFGPQFDSGGR